MQLSSNVSSKLRWKLLSELCQCGCSRVRRKMGVLFASGTFPMATSCGLCHATTASTGNVSIVGSCHRSHKRPARDQQNFRRARSVNQSQCAEVIHPMITLQLQLETLFWWARWWVQRPGRGCTQKPLRGCTQKPHRKPLRREVFPVVCEPLRASEPWHDLRAA